VLSVPDISENLGLMPPPTTAKRFDRWSIEHKAMLPTCSWSIYNQITDN